MQICHNINAYRYVNVRIDSGIDGLCMKRRVLIFGEILVSGSEGADSGQHIKITTQISGSETAAPNQFRQLRGMAGLFSPIRRKKAWGWF